MNIYGTLGNTEGFKNEGFSKLGFNISILEYLFYNS